MLNIVRDELLPEIEASREALETVRPTSPELLSRVITLHLFAKTLYQSLRDNANADITANQSDEFGRLMSDRDHLMTEVSTFLGKDVGPMASI